VIKRITAALAQERSKTGGSWTQKSMGTDHVVAHVVHHVKRIAEEGVIHKGVAPHHRAHHAHVSVHFFEASTVLNLSVDGWGINKRIIKIRMTSSGTPIRHTNGFCTRSGRMVYLSRNPHPSSDRMGIRQYYQSSVTAPHRSSTQKQIGPLWKLLLENGLFFSKEKTCPHT
jgi:hypothetical protein